MVRGSAIHEGVIASVLFEAADVVKKSDSLRQAQVFTVQPQPSSQGQNLFAHLFGMFLLMGEVVRGGKGPSPVILILAIGFELTKTID